MVYDQARARAEDVVLEKYPHAVRVDDSDKWLLRTVVYEVTPYFPS